MITRSPKKLADIHELAIKRFDRAQENCADEREICLSDRRFYTVPGAPWEGDYGEQFQNKPRLEINKVHLSVIRIFNEYRNNRFTVLFEDPNNSDQTFANACTSMFRASEKLGDAVEAYDNAFEEAIGGGFGAFRVRACYANEDNEYEDDSMDSDSDEYQEARFEPIYDADISVFFDPSSRKYDKSDAKWCFVVSPIPTDDFEEIYGTNDPDVQVTVTSSSYEWFGTRITKIAEYYVKEKEKDVVIWFKDPTETTKKVYESELEEKPDLLEELSATGFKEVKRKKITKIRVRKYLISGSRVLKDCGLIAGPNIPIVPVYGKRWFIEHIERCQGHVRMSKDAQILKNMQMSKLAELSAASSIEKPIFAAEQVKGFEEEWSNDSVNNYSYLRVNPLKDINGNIVTTQPIGYTKSPSIPPATAALLQTTEQDIQDILGNQQNGEQIQPNISGMVVELVQNRLEMQSYIYISNMNKSIKRGAEIWLGMSRELLVEEGRKVDSEDVKGSSNKVELMKKVTDESGAIVFENDFSKAKFRVVANVGPSSETKKRGIIRTLSTMLNIVKNQDMIDVITYTLMMNLEGEGVDDITGYCRTKLIKMGVIEPTELEAKKLAEEAANAQPDPQSQYLQAAAAEAEANAAESRANTLDKVASSEKKKAEILDILSGIDLREKQHLLEIAKEISNSLSSTTSEQPPPPAQ